MTELNLKTLDDGCIKVCLEEDGISACCIVSSHHLVQEKESQLRQAILSKAVESFVS